MDFWNGRAFGNKILNHSHVHFKAIEYLQHVWNIIYLTKKYSHNSKLDILSNMLDKNYSIYEIYIITLPLILKKFDL